MKLRTKENYSAIALIFLLFSYAISASYGMDGDLESEIKKSEKCQGLKDRIKDNQSKGTISSFSSLERRKQKRLLKNFFKPLTHPHFISRPKDIALEINPREEADLASLYNIGLRLSGWDKALVIGNISDKEEALLKNAKSFYWWQRAHTSEDSEAWFELGKMYNDGRGVKQDWGEAIKWFYMAAYNDHPYAPLHITWLDRWYQDLPQNTEEAIEWCRTAGDGCYYGWRGVTQDYVKALDWYHKAANLGNVTTQYQLGIIYEAGAGVKRNPEEAAKWFSKAVAQDATYGNRIGDLYAYGGIGTQRIQQDYIQAMNWYLEAAKRENLSAQIKVGILYESGKGVERNRENATKWFNRAFAQNFGSKNYIAYLYCYGLEGVQEDYIRARKWDAANEKDHAEAQFQMGLLYHYGLSVGQDFKKAMEWYLKAAQQHNVKAQKNIAVLYHNGQGVPQDYVKAMEWYLKAAAQNDAMAQCNIGCLYHSGRGASQDYTKAMEWYLKAAKQNYPEAQNNIGLLYDNARGISQDYTKAMEWYLKAAAQNYPEAQNNIGLLYEWGQGVPKDIEEARKWYLLAASGGSEFAKQNLERLEEQ